MSAIRTGLILLVLSFCALWGNITFAQDDVANLKDRINAETGIAKAEALNQFVEELKSAFILLYSDEIDDYKRSERKLHHEIYGVKKIRTVKKSTDQTKAPLEAAENRYIIFRYVWLAVIIFFLFTIAYILKKKEKRQILFRQELAKDSKSELIQRMRTEHNSQIIKTNLKDLVDGNTIDKIIHDLKISSKNTFDEDFLIIYHKLDEEFFPNLRKKHSNLTKHDQVLCGMIKMGLDSKQIAHITFRTPESIHVARSRLRKKLGMKAKEDLGLYLQDF